MVFYYKALNRPVKQWYDDLGGWIGSEQKGNRPVVIIQNNVGNKHSPTVIIAAITSKANIKAKLPTHYYLDAGNGLALPSLVLLEQIRTVDKRRLSDYIGRLNETHIRGINHALAISIGLIEPVPPKLTICLCGACADAFRGTGAFALREAAPGQAEKEVCVYCHQRPGVDYELEPNGGRAVNPNEAYHAVTGQSALCHLLYTSVSNISVVGIHTLCHHSYTQPEAQNEIFQGSDAVDFML